VNSFETGLLFPVKFPAVSVVALFTDLLIADLVASHAAFWTSRSSSVRISRTVVLSIMLDTDWSVVSVGSHMEFIFAPVTSHLGRSSSEVVFLVTYITTFESWLIRTNESLLASIVLREESTTSGSTFITVVWLTALSGHGHGLIFTDTFHGLSTNSSRTSGRRLWHTWIGSRWALTSIEAVFGIFITVVFPLVMSTYSTITSHLSWNSDHEFSVAAVVTVVTIHTDELAFTIVSHVFSPAVVSTKLRTARPESLFEPMSIEASIEIALHTDLTEVTEVITHTWLAAFELFLIVRVWFTRCECHGL